MSSLTAIGRLIAVSGTRGQVALASIQTALVLGALALPLTAAPQLDKPLPVPGGISLFVADVVVFLAVATWLGARMLLPSTERRPLLQTPVLGWPLLAFAVLLVPGIIRGHDRYGASLVGQPLRLVVYAGLAFAMTELRPRELYRGIVAVFYAGALWQVVLAAHYLATNTSQTPIRVLSTGGVRVLSLTTGMYLAATLVLALLNLDLERGRSRRAVALHLAAATLATIGIVLSYSRTTFLALALVLPVLFWQLPWLRGTVLRRWRWWLPVAAAAVAAIVVLLPTFTTRVVDRVTANPLADQSVRWRLAGIHAVLSGMRSGENGPAGPVTPTAVVEGNSLSNDGFENGTVGWNVQGGRLSTIPSNNPNFGERSLRIVTRGDNPDEGMYSDPVVASPGQTWTFSIWLKGAAAGDRVNVAIWEYDQRENAVVRANFPVTLTITPTQYFVRWTLIDPSTTHIRALVRTPDTAASAEAVDAYGDSASLVREIGSGDAGTANANAPEGGAAAPSYGPGGVLQPTLGLAATGPSALPNGDFEGGTQRWKIQGGQIVTVPGATPHFGALTLEMKTDGTTVDQGIYSAPVPVKAGQTWTFQVWLWGARGDEQVNVSLWRYDLQGDSIGRTDFPVTLTTLPTRYYTTAQIPDDGTVNIRALVRTREEPQVVGVFADNAELGLRAASAAGVGAPPRTRQAPGSFQIDRPLLGLGFGRVVDYTWEGRFYRVEGDPDNSFVYILAGGGALALASFLLLMGAYVRDALRRLRETSDVERSLIVWALSAWFIVMVNCAMAPFLPRSKIVLTLWALLLLPALVRRSDESSAERQD